MISVNWIPLNQQWLKMNVWQVWQRCHAYVWYQCRSYKYIRETKMSTLRRNMFATTYMSALLDHQLWILMWWLTLVHTASWCTWSVNRIHGQSYLNESCKIFCRLSQAACKWIGLQVQAISLMTSRLRTSAVMAWLQFMHESSLHSH
jgi:hypothetical protein